MAHAGRYEPVTSVEDSKPADDTSISSTRLTPDSDFDDEDAIELQEFAREGLTRLAREEDTISGAEQDGDENDDEAPLAGRGRRRRSSAQSFELYTPDEERAVRRKLDTRLVLFVSFLYMLSFLDRTNIGNCKVAGMMSDLRLSDSQFEWLLWAFHITYALFEPMTVCYKLFPPHIYLTGVVFFWGLLAALQSMATSFAFEMAMRVLLGVAEAAFVGMPIYLSFFYRREELAFRTGIFIAAAPLANTFASSLAYAIVQLGDSTSVASWRLVFLLEGFPACVVAVVTFYWIADSPSTAPWLTPRERKVAAVRLRRETASAEKANSQAQIPRHKQGFNWAPVLSALIDLKCWLMAIMFFCCNVAYSSMPVFLPTILNQMGWSKLASQGVSVPPYVFAFFAVLATAFLSDRLKTRSIPFICHTLLAAVGYVVLAMAGVLQISPILRYLAIFLVCAGFYSAITVIITWNVNNQATDEGKTTSLAIMNVVGQLGPLLGTVLYPDAEGPYFVKGMGICAGSMALAAVLALALRFVLQAANAKRKGSFRRGDGDVFEFMI